jgi:ketosteroid isomerase-like protein
MFHSIAKRQTLNAFAALSRRDPDTLLARCSEDMTHVFAGDHALGGTRNSKAAFTRWIERLNRLFPVLEFQPREVLVRGPPWNMTVAVFWTDRGEAADGTPYENAGAHELRLTWGRLTALRAHLDTQRLSATLDRMARNGLDEAAAAPIGDDR